MGVELTKYSIYLFMNLARFGPLLQRSSEAAKAVLVKPESMQA
jgi:hypothetical protein